MTNGSGSASRYSTTVRYDMLYRAFHQTGAGHDRVIRVAAPLRDVEDLVSSFRKSLLFGPAPGFDGGITPCRNSISSI